MELWRIFPIGSLATTLGILSFLALDALFPEADASPSSLSVLFLALMWLPGTGISIVLGLLLHLAIGRLHLPSISILLLFVVVAGAATTGMFFVLHGITTHIFALGIGSGVSAWALYCYGPLKLWQPPQREA